MRWRSWKAAIVIVLIGVTMAGVATLPGGRSQDPPAASEDSVPHQAVRSSTRGVVTLALESPGGEVVGGLPFDPGGDEEAAADPATTVPTPPGATPEAGASAESVLGPDGRIWLRNRTTAYPNSAIGRLDFRQGGRTYWCTGSLIDADTVLTAGHCVHDGMNGETGWSTRVEFIPGAEGNTAPFGSCDAVELLTLPGWYGNGSEYQDLGLVQLDCSIGDTVGWFGYRSAQGRSGLMNVPVHLRGYPGDKVWSSLWTIRDRVRASQAQMVFYAADTYGGQSGSPVFNFRQCNGVRGPCVLAVHAYGVHPGRNHREFNHGPRLDEVRVATMSQLAAAPGVAG
jgi:glutamyl endopeptidase